MIQAADLAYLQRSYSFNSVEQAQYFVQGVGLFCSQKEHHPEWSVSEGGRTVNVKLTSHFAGNKVTLFDFQLAEHMNKQSAITQKWFVKYPLLTNKSWSSIKIFVASFVLFHVVLQIGTNWGNILPSSQQRGQRPVTNSRPYLAMPYQIQAGGMYNDIDAENYAKANVDDYAFKTNMFAVRKII